ncbi:MAG: phosphoribosyl-AMP cyclohydrolase [Pseudomonadota bacterium]
MTADTHKFPAPSTEKKVLEEGVEFTPKFGEDGLLTAVVLDATTGQVLMVGHMNDEAVAATLRTGEAHYWSRSRSELWHKGATSGNVQKVRQLLTDCDQDALVMRVDVTGADATCHTGRKSCFYREVPLQMPPADLNEIDNERHFDPDVVYGKS